MTAYSGQIAKKMPEMSSATPKTYEKTYHMTIFRNWYFQTVLAASGGLDTTLGGYLYSKPIEDGRNGFRYSKKPGNDISHVFMLMKSSWDRFWGRIWPLVASDLKNVPLWFLIIKISHKYGWLAKEWGRNLKNESRNPHGPSPKCDLAASGGHRMC